MESAEQIEQRNMAEVRKGVVKRSEVSADLAHAQLEGASLLLQLLGDLPPADLVPHHPVLASQLPLLLLHLFAARARTDAHIHTSRQQASLERGRSHSCLGTHAHTLSIQAILNHLIINPKARGAHERGANVRANSEGCYQRSQSALVVPPRSVEGLLEVLQRK